MTPHPVAPTDPAAPVNTDTVVVNLAGMLVQTTVTSAGTMLSAQGAQQMWHRALRLTHPDCDATSFAAPRTKAVTGWATPMGRCHIDVAACPTFRDRLTDVTVASPSDVTAAAKVAAVSAAKLSPRRFDSWWSLLIEAGDNICYRCTVGPALAFLFADTVTAAHPKTPVVVTGWSADRSRSSSSRACSPAAVARFTAAAHAAGVPVYVAGEVPFVVVNVSAAVRERLAGVQFVCDLPAWFDAANPVSVDALSSALLLMGTHQQQESLTVDPFEAAAAVFALT